MPEALALLKRALGPDAVILGTRFVPAGTVGTLLGRQICEITAAAATPAPAAPTSEFSDDAYVRLVQNEMAEELARRVVQSAAQRCRPGAGAPALHRALREELAQLIPDSPGIQLSDARRRTVALVGPAGGGKTTTLAKLAAHFALRLRKRVAILSLDMHRLATHAQIRRYGEIIRVPVHTAQTVSGVKQALAQLADVELLLIDTAGASRRDSGRLARLAALLRSVRPDEVHLVLPASLSTAAQLRAAETFAGIGASHAILTHLDDVVGLGVVFTAIQKLGLPASFLSAGQVVPDDLEIACGRRLAGVLLDSKSDAPPRSRRGTPQGGGRELGKQAAIV